MLKVGLTGGYASGKTFVAQRLEQSGCGIVYADLLGRQVLQPGGLAYQPTLEWFAARLPNAGLVNADGTIHRKKLAALVFEDPQLLEELNEIVHPAVFQLEAEALASFESHQPNGIAVIEAAILIETGRYHDFDRLIVTSCTREIQIVRAMERDQVTREEAERRLSRQLPDKQRIRYAHYVIDTGGSAEQTTRQVDGIYVQLRQLAEARNS